MLDGEIRPQGNPHPPRRVRRSPNSRDTDGPWGHKLDPTKHGFRIGFQNINGLPVDATRDQHTQLTTTLSNLSFDIFGAQEINLNLTHLEPTHHWWRRFKGAPFFSFPAHNIHTNSRERRLFGGTATFVANPTSQRILEHGTDSSGLGRWTWVLLSGRQGIRTRIINGYRPVRDTTNRPGTVYSQQEKYYYDQHNPREPRAAFLEDLAQLIRQCIQDQEQIVLGMDANEYIYSDQMQTWATDLGLHTPLTQLHPRLPDVDTCEKGRNNRPIDGIWTTVGIDITKGGMTGFGEVSIGSSDHRLLWIDVTHESMFGFTAPIINRRPKSFFPLHDPLAVRRYNNYLNRQRQEHQIPQQLSILQHRALHGHFDNNDQRQYERLCTLDDSIRQTARQQSRRFYAGQVLYSDVIGRDYKELRLWQLVIKRRSGIRTDTRNIRRLMRKTQQMHALQVTLEEAKLEKQRCFRQYLQHKRDQTKLREAFERKQDQRIADAKGITLLTQQKLRRSTRQTKAIFSNIRRVIGSKPCSGLTSVEYNDHGTQDIIECYQRQEIEEACAMEGHRRFTQAQFTPFMQGSLLQDLGHTTHQEAADQILTGTYHCKDDVDRYTQLFINELSIPEPIRHLPVITGITTPQAHIFGWKRMKHTTASSPFGPLFSDYIAGTQDPQVARIDNTIANIPLIAGFCPTLWTKAVDVMISKKTHSSNVEKLRIIVLFHAMYNMINKRVGKLMVERALRTNQIPIEAFGSVPGRRANDCALNKALTNDTLRQQRRPAALCSNDATSCYDRIVHVVASLCMQRMGVHSTTCKVMFNTLQELQHYVSTAFGTSETPYSGVHIPLQGVGQGNGAGPAIWLLMTIPLINMLRRQGYGFHSISPLTHHHCHLACFTFVDDTDTIHTPQGPNPTAAQALREIQEAINLWEGGLRATGGTLSPSKSYWYLIDFKWNCRTLTWQYKTTQDAPGELHLSNPDGNRIPLQRHEPHHAIETLGIPLAMDGNQTSICTSLRNKINKWADKIKTKQLTLSETILSLQYGLSRTLDYPLTATRLTKQQCNALMKPLRQAALPALHIPTTFPTILAHAPKDYLGLGLPNLWFEQGLAQVDCFLRHSYDMDSDSTNQLYAHVIEGLQLELGLPGSPFEHDIYLYSPSTTPTQLHVIWQFCWDMGIHIQTDTSKTLPPRLHDRFLMAYFPTQGFSPRELRLLNLCRLHLRIQFVSDLCTGDGNYLDKNLAQQRTPFPSHNHIKWPVTGAPNAHCWALWSRAVHSLTEPTARTANLPLQQPLGPWHRIPPGWSTFLSPTGLIMYHREQDSQLFRKATTPTYRHNTRHPTYTRQPGLHHLPPDSIPTTLRVLGGRWGHTGSARMLPPPEPTTPRWWGTIVRSPDSLSHILRGIANGSALVVTDGSYKNGLGTAAFTIRADELDLDGLDCVNMTPGTQADLDPFRAELGGIYGSIKTVHTILLHSPHHTARGTITLACDCLSAIQRITQAHHPPPKTPHYDLIMTIRLLLSSAPVNWIFQHVHGHQDRTQHYTLLDRPSQLNVDMDQLAKSYWIILNSHRPTPFGLPANTTPYSLWCGAHRLTTWNRQLAQQLFYNRATRQYWQQHSTTPLDDIAWAASGAALRRLALYQQTWVPRWLTSFLPTGHRLRLLNPDNSNACPRCSLPETHRYHVIRCPHPEAMLLWQTHTTSLDAWMQRQHTKPTLRHAIMSLLNQWYEDLPWNPPPSLDNDDNHTFASQQRAGTVRVMDGFLVSQWAEVQQKYYEWIQKRYTGRRWLSRLIQKLWEIAWDLWRHRQKVLQTPTALFISQRHTNLDRQITQAYQQHFPTPTPRLARWFSQPLPSLLAESLDFKQQWLAMIRTIQENHP